MVAPIVWAGVALVGVVGAGWAAGKAEDALDATAQVAKWSAVGAGLYVSYKALQSAGALK